MVLYIDITSATSALKSLENWLGIARKNVLDFVSRQKYISYSQDYIKELNIDDRAVLQGDLSLVSLHVTTNDDNCDSIRKYGLMNLQYTINNDTVLGIYLREQGVNIDFAQKTIKYKNEVYSIAEKDEYAFPGSKEYIKNSVIRKLYRDYQINGFFCCKNVLQYGGGVRHRPEILNNLSAMLNNQDISYNWIKRDNSCYVLKYTAGIAEFDYCSFNIKPVNDQIYEENKAYYELAKRKWILTSALSVIFNDMFECGLPELFSYANFNTNVPFENIVIYTDKEYICNYHVRD